jgi:UDP-GlcNAc:undecaprenyl-phosphate GlcNAc-1-phosphate transferase
LKYQELIFVLIISYITTLLFIYWLRPVAIKFDIVDKPSERKSHYGYIPLVGGISIFMGVLLSIIGQIYDNNILISFMLSSFFIFTLGFIDDCHPLSPKLRLFLQIIIISPMVLFADLKFDTFGHSFGLDQQIHLGVLAYPITIIGMIFVTNAFNLMDGADGIVGLLVVLGIIGINFTKIFYSDLNFNLLSIALLGGTIAFLRFNITSSIRKKIFLGDNGSLFLGYTVSFLLLYETQVEKSISPTFALWIIAIPVFDTVAVMVYRLKNRVNLFTPDKTHLHHFLQKLGWNNKKVLLIIIGSGGMMLFLAFLIEYYNQSLSFPVYLCFLIIYVWLRVFIKNSKA